jgi:multidrug efflux pump subunit AcrA (membrane-fusion protein)
MVSDDGGKKVVKVTTNEDGKENIEIYEGKAANEYLEKMKSENEIEVNVDVKEENGKKVARKKPVNIGEFYDAQIEVKTGLTAGEQLITKGFQGLYEGQVIATEMN